MEYRTLGKTGLRVSVIGLGMEHLPVQEPEAATAIIREALDGGVNYFDLLAISPEARTFYGRALRGRRDGVILAAHLGLTQENGQYSRTRDVAQCEALFDELLQQLGTDHVDILHLHNLDDPAEFERLLESGYVGLAQRLKAQGRARFMGLSGHGPDVSRRVVAEGLVDVLMHPVALYVSTRDWMTEGSMDLLAYCAARGVGVVAMKPFGGGAVFHRDNAAEAPITPVQCIAYTLAQPAVCTALTGVKTLDELRAALAYLDASEAERDYAYAAQHVERQEAGCTYCNHCLPCPERIEIAQVMRLLVAARQGMTDALRAQYNALTFNAADCVACGVCAERCPFGIEVVERMEEAAALYA